MCCECGHSGLGVPLERPGQMAGTRGVCRGKSREGSDAIETLGARVGRERGELPDDVRRRAKPSGGHRGWTKIDTGQRYPEPASGFPAPKLSIGWLRAHAACLANFLQSVAEGSSGDPGLNQGINIQRLIAAARTSARTGAWTEV